MWLIIGSTVPPFFSTTFNPWVCWPISNATSRLNVHLIPQPATPTLCSSCFLSQQPLSLWRDGRSDGTQIYWVPASESLDKCINGNSPNLKIPELVSGKHNLYMGKKMGNVQNPSNSRIILALVNPITVSFQIHNFLKENGWNHQLLHYNCQ